MSKLRQRLTDERGFALVIALGVTIVLSMTVITVIEAADTTFYDSPDTEKPVGFGQPIDHADLQTMAAQGTAIFGERSKA